MIRKHGLIGGVQIWKTKLVPVFTEAGFSEVCRDLTNGRAG